MASRYDRVIDNSNYGNSGNDQSSTYNYTGSVWQHTITTKERNAVANKMLQAIFPIPDPNALLDKRMQILVAYTRRVEYEMYRKAGSRGEYHSLIAEKIYKIQKELSKKREARKWQPRQLK